MLHGVIKQFFMEVRWKDLDYLVVDLPPAREMLHSASARQCT